MSRSLLTIHRFFLSQSLYPLLLSTGLALTLFAGRVIFSGTTLIYRNLVWNLFLAWIPYGFAFTAAALHRLFPRQWWLLIVPAGLWLLFFPNAAYIITDFLHLEERPYIPLWYDILLLSTSAWTGIFLAIASLRTIQELVKVYLGAFLSWLFVGFALALNGLGIYLGRFERWNSWDLLFQPRRIVADIADRFANPFENLRFFGFTFLFTAFLLVIYLMFLSMRHTDDSNR
jgi:uncharacterized membrane protein